MLGSVAEAEDVVQEALLRLHQADDVDNPEAFLTTVTTRLAIDLLRSARVRREAYVGSWLPEPLVEEDAARTSRRTRPSRSRSSWRSSGCRRTSAPCSCCAILREFTPRFPNPVHGRPRQCFSAAGTIEYLSEKLQLDVPRKPDLDEPIPLGDKVVNAPCLYRRTS